MFEFRFGLIGSHFSAALLLSIEAYTARNPYLCVNVFDLLKKSVLKSEMQPIFFLILLLISGVNGNLGIDISVSSTAETMECLAKSQNMTYLLTRVYRCIGEVDSIGAQTMTLALAQSNPSFQFVDGYIFPCIATANYTVSNNITCPSASQQIADTIQLLEEYKVLDKQSKSNPIRLWLDVEDESPSKYYDSDPAVNQVFLEEMTTALLSKNIRVGVYTTKSYWKQIMDNQMGYGARFPLWYPRYDAVNSLDFFEPFADFAQVLIKQTAGDTGMCGVTLDTNFME